MSAETSYASQMANLEPEFGGVDPFGGDRMIAVDPEQAIGMLACMQKGTSVDDDDSGDQVSKADDYVSFTVESMGTTDLDNPASLN
jgi:hypothetical protein